jgi:eukaryotic-like serine/threonine-protein kinase
VLATETVLGGRYRLGPIIGRGGGADVFRADDLETGRPVAVKVLRSATPADLHRFEQEGRTLARLDHPAIVRMCDDGDQDGVPYLVLDLIDGEPLSMVLHRGPLPEDEVMRVGAVLASALAHAHEIGVVHRDVKPGNVLFDSDGDVHLTDFGIARLTDVTAITATGFVIGTAAYLAPEQVSGEGATPASDVYALGLVLLEALTGERAYEGTPSEAALARLQRAPVIPPTTNGALGALIASMTSSEPSLRPSAAAIAEALNTSAHDVPADATAVLPVFTDATTAVALPAAAVATAATSTAPAGRASQAPVARPAAPRWLRAALVAAALVATLLFVGSSLDGGSTTPASTTPSTVATTPASLVTATAPSTTAPAPAPPKGKHPHGGH